MLIRKLFKFEGAHVVRNCTTPKCMYSVHGHSYKVEVMLSSQHLDNGQMVMDFSLLKRIAGQIIDAFDHTILLWCADDKPYLDAQKLFSKRWLELSVSPSAEQLSRILFALIECRLKREKLVNGENGVSVYSVIVHETDTGYAQAFGHDVVHNLDKLRVTAASEELKWLLAEGRFNA